jgi:hypothetical protein
MILTITIDHVEGERSDQIRHALGDAVSRAAYEIGQNSPDFLPVDVRNSSGLKIGTITWGPDALVRDQHLRDQRRAELEAAKIARQAMSAEDQFKARQFMEEAE